ncbi:MAG TPA: hypothetical protein VIO94_15425 [Phenylobacterium sp.]
MKPPARLRASEAWKIASAGIVLGVLPHLFGLLFGFAAFLLTPIVGALGAVGVGMLARRVAPAARLAALLVASSSTGATFVACFYATFAALAVRNGAWLQTMGVAQASIMFAAATLAAALPISLGIWLGWHRLSPEEP